MHAKNRCRRLWLIVSKPSDDALRANHPLPARQATLVFGRVTSDEGRKNKSPTETRLVRRQTPRRLLHGRRAIFSLREGRDVTS